MRLEWSDEILVGVELIDTQHKELFRVLNELLEAVEERSEYFDVEGMIEFLEAYVLDHFDTEEGKMKALAYPGLKDHIYQHRVFTYSLNDLKRSYKQEGASEALLLGLQSRLCNWLFNHILKKDLDFGRHIRLGPEMAEDL